VRRVLLLALSAFGPAVWAQEVPLEYHVKAAYLFNFVQFVEWPAGSADGPLVICVARPSPFGDVLASTLRDERVGGRPIDVRVIGDPDGSCHVLFIPRDAPAAAYLQSTRSSPTLTVGESAGFLRGGGIINFIREGANIRFEIDEAAARRAGLRISSRLLRLARMPAS
jgi:hypothetical protein